MSYDQVIRDSSAFEVIRAEAMQTLLLRLGRKRFGPEDAGTVAALEAILDVERLQDLGDRLLDANSWQDLLATS